MPISHRSNPRPMGTLLLLASNKLNVTRPANVPRLTRTNCIYRRLPRSSDCSCSVDRLSKLNIIQREISQSPK